MQSVYTHFWFVLSSNFVLFLVFGLWFARSHNNLNLLGEGLREGWGQIEAQLQRRYDALLSMSQVVQGYAGHEQAIDAVVAKARSSISSGQGLEQRVERASQAEAATQGFMGRVINVATTFPDLKANQHFQALMQTINETSSEITQRRERYNALVHNYNAALKNFPQRLYAQQLGFCEAQYFAFDKGAASEMPHLAFEHQAVADGAAAGSAAFPGQGLHHVAQQERLAPPPPPKPELEDLHA